MASSEYVEVSPQRNRQGKGEMTADEKCVRDKCRAIKALCKRLCTKKKPDVQPAPAEDHLGNQRAQVEGAVFDANARGFQDGWSTRSRQRQDSRARPSHGNESFTTDSIIENRHDSHNRRQSESQAFRLGWNRGWELVKEDGWTQGRISCSPYRRHSNVVRRRSAVAEANSIYRIPDVRLTAANDSLRISPSNTTTTAHSRRVKPSSGS